MLTPTASLSARVDPEAAKSLGPLLHGWARRTQRGLPSYPRHIDALRKVSPQDTIYQALGGDEMAEWIKAYSAPLQYPQVTGYPVDIRGLPYGGPNNGKDNDGQFFSHRTEFFEGLIESPPVIYVHGESNDVEPEILGRIINRWYDDTGGWFRIDLDPTSSRYSQLVAAHQKGALFASTGVVPAFYKYDERTGEILSWLVGEFSLVDLRDGYRPSNRYAIAKAEVVLHDYYGEEVVAKEPTLFEKIMALFDRFRTELSELKAESPCVKAEVDAPAEEPMPELAKCADCDQAAEEEAQKLNAELLELQKAQQRPSGCIPCMQWTMAMVKANKVSFDEAHEMLKQFRVSEPEDFETLKAAIEGRENVVVGALAKAKVVDPLIAGGNKGNIQDTIDQAFLNRMRREAGMEVK